MFSTMSTTSSRTPGIDENSCSTLSILIDVTAAPCSEDSSTRRSALPSVRPKPRSSGSATIVAVRLASTPASVTSFSGLMRSCQFFGSTGATSLDRLFHATPAHLTDRTRDTIQKAGDVADVARQNSDATALRRTAAVVRDRRHVADRGDRETDRLQRTQRGLTSRTRAAHLDLQGAHAMLHGLAARALGRHLGGERRGLARALEALLARRRPGDGVALGVRDRDDRVVERGVHVSDARDDVLAFLAARARGGSGGAARGGGCRLGHVWIPLELLRDFFLAGDRLGRTLAGARIGMRALAMDRQAAAMPQTAIAGEVHQSLDVHRHFAAQVTLDRIVMVDGLADADDLVVGQRVHAP